MPGFDREAVDAAFSRHTNIAFQFSGGKDSTAALYLLEDYWPRMTVFWCAADPLPELREYVERIASDLPSFVEVPGGLQASVDRYGLPSDLVPYDATESARLLNVGGPVKLQERYACCFRSIMAPMYGAMLERGVTLVIRGQKGGDELKGPLSSGDVVDGIEYVYPIEQWTDKNVFDFLRLKGVEIPRYYSEGMSHSFDCATCTAWLHEPRGAYLKKHYPERYQEYREKLATVARAAYGPVSNIINELAVCNIEIKD